VINTKLISPKSIAVIGASENTTKPGGKVLENLLKGNFAGEIYAVNHKPVRLPGVTYAAKLTDLPPVDVAILAMPAEGCADAVAYLAARGTGGFIVFSAGFGEAGHEGIAREKEMVATANRHGATLIGPNCIGLLNANYKGVFTTPIPEYFAHGCELISSSGATAVFIMEAAESTGLKFSNVYSIGNAAQTGIEEILEYLDENYDPENSPRVKLLYLENIRQPQKFLKHAASLIAKGCHIAAIKSGFSEAGGRATSSHTGAMATGDNIIRALFKKAGIVYCSSREELIYTACVWQNKPLRGKNIAIITHAGGSAVMLTDTLTSLGMAVPPIPVEKSHDLLAQLYPGSSVTNPIDFLATGTAAQLGKIIDFCEALDEIDGMVVVFGSPGLFNVADVYEVLDTKMKACTKPIFPVLPSLVNAAKEINVFLQKGHVNHSDEVELGRALAYVHSCKAPSTTAFELPKMDVTKIREIIATSAEGYLGAAEVREVLRLAGIPIAEQAVCKTLPELLSASTRLAYPLVLKVVGPVHKSDVGGVSLNINSEQFLTAEFYRMMQLPGAEAVLLQHMVAGHELYCGAAKKEPFGHLVLCGLGGIFVELLEDVAQGLAPLSPTEVAAMLRTLKGYPIIQGYRGKPGINEAAFIDAVVRVATLVHLVPEIIELDINPFKSNQTQVVAVDARIRIEK
jgi:acetyltransferase